MACVKVCQLKFNNKYVEKTKKYMPDKFTELCHTHLASLLELNGDQLQQLLSSGQEEHQKKSGLPSLGMFKKKVSTDKSHGLFGLPLTDEGVCLMIPLIQFLKQEMNVTSEGLFRKPGSKSKMVALKELLIAHGPTVSIDTKDFSVDDVASVLKEFIRELPEPLLTERHLEAHKIILALGQHAKTPEEIADYSSKKLTALQLLMQLLPSPAQTLIMHLVLLLRRVANSPESRMTPASLGTIFAPIFYIDRKVQPIDLYSQIITTAPGVSFIIDKAHELFQPPKELVTDLVKLWTPLQQAFLHSQIREYGQIKKSLTGQTLDTNVCCDNEVLRRDYGASNITAELANYLEYIQTDDTKPKKSVDALKVYAGLRRRSKSIGSSVKTARSAWTQLFAFSTRTSDTRQSVHSRKPGHKHHFTSDICPTAVSSTPAKRKCQETVNSKTSLTVTDNQKHHDEVGCEALQTSNKSSANVDSDFVKNRHPRGLPSDLQDPATYDIENKENFGSATCDIKNKDSSHHTSRFNGKTDPGNSCMLQPHLGPAHAASSGSVAKSKGLSVRSDIPGFPHVAAKKTTMSETTSRNSNPVINACQQQSEKPETTVKAHTTIRLIPDAFRETSV